jgi:hypothetical protein
VVRPVELAEGIVLCVHVIPFVDEAAISVEYFSTATNTTGPAGAGLTELEALDAADCPLALVAVTVKVYAVPFDNPLTVIGLDAPVPVAPPGEAVTV